MIRWYDINIECGSSFVLLLSFMVATCVAIERRTHSVYKVTFQTYILVINWLYSKKKLA